ncbi:MAG: gluconokinase [Martelella sp.]|uniref:gluconokinase n=1 Tax=unclassified Martelella TaxID=2629616 RepID=UPI000C4931F5|nr:gluconokinase [Martelella sp.]MAU21461.1 gluconokinase [Martelella sp.]|tara:strand:- start:2047 stop:2586 length:540 start_codon:yes stop_codon:yes gene_type:complete
MNNHDIEKPGAIPDAIIVMGVSGSGKSSVARRLAERAGHDFIEGDELHPAANVEKMSRGIPLQDEDRWPWLALIGAEIARHRRAGVVVTCSALKKAYRDRLRQTAGGSLAFVFLDGSEALLSARMGHRTGHFMPVSLLQSQLATLERPDGEPGVVVVDIDQSLEAIVEAALAGLATAFD